jgi:cytochrome c
MTKKEIKKQAMSILKDYDLEKSIKEAIASVVTEITYDNFIQNTDKEIQTVIGDIDIDGCLTINGNEVITSDKIEIKQIVSDVKYVDDDEETGIEVEYTETVNILNEENND